MIAFIKGKLAKKNSTEVIIDCNGVGYLLYVSLNTSENLPELNSEVVLHTLLIHREDAMNLYGFYDESERTAFRLITSISGIGPKIAIGILSSLTVAQLQQYILAGNIPALTKLPGIGKKTAERVVLELKDKLSKTAITDVNDVHNVKSVIISEAMAALTILGYNPSLADKCIKKVIAEFGDEDLTAEILIKKSLKFAMS